jgi:hypothetical protein
MSLKKTAYALIIREIPIANINKKIRGRGNKMIVQPNLTFVAAIITNIAGKAKMRFTKDDKHLDIGNMYFGI